MVEIRTPRLLLRGANSADLEAIHEILSDPTATAYWSTPPHSSVEQTRDWLDSMIAVSPHQGEDFIVEHEGRVIGKMGLHEFPVIGFIFHPDHWGRGFALEAARPVIDRAFSVHGLEHIEADVDPRNAASLALLARLGFAETGRAARTWLVGDEWCDSVYLRLRDSDWRAGETGGGKL